MPRQSRDQRHQEYLAFARQRPELFGPQADAGVRILLDLADIRAVEDAVAADLRRRGLPEEGAEIGIILKDPWVLMLRDAVEFPDGARRAYARAMNRTGDGAAVLPLYDGRIILTRQFRHALRRWSLEIPRGGIDTGKTAEQTSRDEVREEIGGEIGELVPVGFLHGSTNLYYNGAHLYLGRLTKVGAPQLAEAITSLVQVTVPEFERLLHDGEITDSYTVATFCYARMRGLI